MARSEDVDGSLDQEAEENDDPSESTAEPASEDAGENAGLEENDPMNPGAWHAEPGICGSCIAWRPEDPRPGEDVAAGACKLRPELGRVPATLKLCGLYKQRGRFVYQPGRAVAPSRRRSGSVKIIRKSSREAPRIEGRVVPPMDRSQQRPSERPFDRLAERLEARETLVHVVPPPQNIDLGGDESVPVLRQALVELMRTELGRTRRSMHPKFKLGGSVEVRSTNGEMTRMTAERFFASLDYLRASLDALEAVIKKTAQLASDEGELVDNIRRIHGTMTTFNILFEDRGDYFTGSG